MLSIKERGLQYNYAPLYLWCVFFQSNSDSSRILNESKLGDKFASRLDLQKEVFWPSEPLKSFRKNNNNHAWRNALFRKHVKHFFSLTRYFGLWLVNWLPFFLKQSWLSEGFEPRSHVKSRLSLIVWVKVVLNRIVVVDSDLAQSWLGYSIGHWKTRRVWKGARAIPAFTNRFWRSFCKSLNPEEEHFITLWVAIATFPAKALILQYAHKRDQDRSKLSLILIGVGVIRNFKPQWRIFELWRSSFFNVSKLSPGRM